MLGRNLLLALLITVSSFCAHKTPAESTGDSVDFAKQVAPLLHAKCVECHDASLQMAELRLDSRQAMIDGGAVIPGDADNSPLVQRLVDRDLGILMPPTGRLTKTEIETLKIWVNSGAKWPESVKLAQREKPTESDSRLRLLRTLIRNDDLQRVQELVSRDRSLIDQPGVHQTTALMHASVFASQNMVRWFLEQDADPNAADEDGLTPLMYATGNDPAITSLLLAHGANPKAKSKLGRTALLIAAAYAGNSEIVKALLDSGSDPKFADQRNWTSVVMAARTGDTQMVKLLLDAGGEIHGGNAKRLSPGTPLMQAVWAGDKLTTKMLLDRGAHTDQVSIDTSLLSATTHGSQALVALLLNSGADPHVNIVTNYIPESPILAASYSDSLNVANVKLLLQRNVDLTKKDNRGETPVSIAKKRGPSPVLKLLDSHALDKSETDAAPKQTDAATKQANTASKQTAANRKIEGEIDDKSKQPDANRNVVVNQTQIRQTVQKSLKLLQSCGPQFFAKSGCTACHQQTATSLVVQMARERGLDVDEQTERQQIKLTATDLGRKRVGFLQRMKSGGTAHRLGYLLWGLAAADYEPDETTDAMFVELAGLQLHNGSWVSDAHRPPTEYSPVTATAVSMNAIQHFSPPGLRAATNARIAKATQWLVDIRPNANAEKAFRLLGLHWGGAKTSHIEQAKLELLKDQNDNGGWSQLPALPPDAYATGLTLYALGQTGALSVDSAAYKNGIAFLLQSVHPDGSWLVRSRSFKFQPYFESGFPHGHDQWISAAATGWATLALLQTVNPTADAALQDAADAGIE